MRARPHLDLLATLLTMMSSAACDPAKPVARPSSRDSSVAPEVAPEAPNPYPDSQAPLTLADLNGTYSLVDFTVGFTSGVLVTSDDVSSFSGTMIMDAATATFEQTITLEGTTQTAVASGLSLSGTQLTLTSTSCTYSISVQLANEQLTTFVAEYAVCGKNWYDEEDVWRRTSRSASDVSAGAAFLAKRPSTEPSSASGGVGAGAVLERILAAP
jgi:hypothetical protein